MCGLIGGYALRNISFGVSRGNSICSKPKKPTCYTMNFYLKDIEPMVWNGEAYKHLVYAPKQKDSVLSFVESLGHAFTLHRYVMTLEGMESGIKATTPQAGKSDSEDDNGDLYE